MRYPFLTTAASLITIASLAGTAHGATIFVRANAAGANNGTSWANAYTSLTSAVTAAAAGDEVWVAAGTYKPTTTAAQTVSFTLKNGVNIRGGFAGFEASLSQRNIAGNPTILSGDLAGNDGPGFVNRSDNSFHVVRSGAGVLSGLLEGFIIRGGHAHSTSQPTDMYGGGIRIDGGHPTINACIIRDNSAAQQAGGVYADGSSVQMVNTAVYANRSTTGLVVFFSSTNGAAIDQCTIAQNTTTNANEFPGVALFSSGGLTTMRNSVVWGNHNPNGGAVQNQVTAILPVSVTGCDLEGSAAFAGAGAGIFSKDPRFVSPLGPDAIPFTGDENLRLGANSPCIDHGLVSSVPLDVFDSDGDGNTTEPVPFDLGWFGRNLDDFGTPNPAGATVDVGAFEFPGTSCLGDLTFDGLVNTSDLTVFLGGFGTSGVLPVTGDFNSDGAVNTADLVALLGVFGQNCNF